MHACLVTLSATFLPQDVSASQEQTLAEMQSLVSAASTPNPPWSESKTGAPGQLGKRIAIVAEDLRNGGILGVAQGVDEASRHLEWQLTVYDAGGTERGRRQAITNAASGKFDGMILIGADAVSMQPQLEDVTRQDIPIVGWHVSARAGPLPDSPVAVNVSTNPLEVARITAMAAVIQSQGKAGVVIFTDSNFAIATSKAAAMSAVIKACAGCELLEVKDIAISKSHELMPSVTQQLMQQYGRRWTHALAINDIYFDYMVPELIKAGAQQHDIKLLSAGDGSSAAFQRIMTGSFQTGTVAEPLNLHGWQLVDELNRLLAGRPADGHIVPAHLVTPDNIHFDGGETFVFDPDNGYREIYRKIWRP